MSTGAYIRTFADSGDVESQGVALVDGDGEHAGIVANPLVVAVVADGGTAAITVQKFGHNPDVTSGVVEDIWSLGGAYSGFLTSVKALRIRAGGSADDDAAGTGARTVIIQGYDGSWVDQTSTLTTAGASASADTTETYIRGFRAYVADCGAYGGSNAGQIVIETIDGDAVCVIEAPDGTNALGSGQTEMAIYTVPDGKRAWVTRTFANVGGSKAATVNFYQRPNADTIAAPFSASRVWAVYGELVGPSESVYQALKGPFSARTDLWASAKGPTGGANIVVEFDVLLEDI